LKLSPGKYVKLQVSDTGSGMDNETLEKIFEPYFTTKSQEEGSGLGLSVVHGILEQCNGSITVSSEEEKGTVFNAYFPWIPAKSDPAHLDTVQNIPGGKEHILLVDDETPVREMMTLMLERLGYQVTGFMYPNDALAEFIKQPDLFDLMVTDMTMPQMTGVDLSRKVLHKKPGTPIILCTGFSSLTDPEQARSIGVKGFIMKPVSKKELANKVRELLDGY